MGDSSWGPILEGENVLAAIFFILCAFPFVGLVVGIVFIIIFKPMSKWFRFNILQGCVLNLGILILAIFIGFSNSLIKALGLDIAACAFGFLWAIVQILLILMVLWIAWLMYNKMEFEIPVAGNLARRNLMDRKEF